MKRTFVLDTNVLLHDPSALFQFMEHDLYVPMIVLEELDAAKKGTSEIARNARQVSRFLDQLIGDSDGPAIAAGVPITSLINEANKSVSGHLFLQTNLSNNEISIASGPQNPDNSILSAALQLHRDNRDVTVVSKDINLRIKARVFGISAEDYFNDKVLDDVDLLYRGVAEVDRDLWTTGQSQIRCWTEQSETFYAVPRDSLPNFFPRQCLYVDDANGLELIGIAVKDNEIVLRQAIDYRQSRHTVWGIEARNREQNFALNLLLDPDVQFVSLVGVAGTGKTLLALAAGLAQCMDKRLYREIIVTRVTVPVGEDIGFLPGTEEEKMTPWMGALMDNLEVLSETEEGGDWGRAASADLIQHRVKVRSLNFMRGRTFLNRFVILDEAQNLTPKQMKTLVTRAGPGTKVVCLGNVAQIDTPYLSETTSGITYVVDRFAPWQHGGHVTLTRGERSPLADFATKNL